MLARVQETWDELGFKIRAVGTAVFVRTDPLPEKTKAGIYLPPSHSDFFGQRLGSKVHMTGTVLSACRTKGYGSKSDRTVPSTLKPGDKVFFTRFEFAWLWRMKDGTRVGHIKEPLIHGVLSESEEDVRLEAS